MEVVSCNLCGSDDHRLVYRMPDARFYRDRWFCVVQCRNCGLGFVNPRPTREQMAEYYPAEFYQDFEVNSAYHQRRYAREAEFVERAVPDGSRRLLDVGCANGDFPRFMMRRGWTVEGVEVSPTANPIEDFPVFRDEFPRLPAAEPRYDAVTAWAVLEHVHDPLAYFRKAAQVLRPGGALVFLVTNFASASSCRLYAEDVPRHLYFFAEPTVRRYMKLTGFRLLKADYSDRIYSMRPVNWLHYLVNFRWRGREYRYQDSTFSRQRYFAEHGLEPSLPNQLRYFVTYPHMLADRGLMRVYEKYQMMTRAYGIVTYVAVRNREAA
jgi:2-polyprenyl-3-methyl-5-hydroxy-6-metoxy-1,4-benzoquinol methylase